MLRNITLAVAGIAAAVVLAPTAEAAPKFCDAHGVGHVYIHACALGGGGGGFEWGTRLRDMQREWASNPLHPNNPNHPSNPGPAPKPPVNP